MGSKGGEVTLSSSYGPRQTAESGQASVSGPTDSLLALLDRLAAELLVRQEGEREDRVDLLSRTPLPALRAYLAGRMAYRRGENDEAVSDYARALDLDSTFTLAGLELAAATGWVFTWAATRDSLSLPITCHSIGRHPPIASLSEELGARSRPRGRAGCS